MNIVEILLKVCAKVFCWLKATVLSIFPTSALVQPELEVTYILYMFYTFHWGTWHPNQGSRQAPGKQRKVSEKVPVKKEFLHSVTRVLLQVCTLKNNFYKIGWKEEVLLKFVLKVSHGKLLQLPLSLVALAVCLKKARKGRNSNLRLLTGRVNPNRVNTELIQLKYISS